MAPLPVLIVGTYDADGTPDAMNVAWGGQCGYEDVAINISASHKTTENILLNRCFTLHIADQSRLQLADYFGIRSGKDKAKLAQVKATVVRGAKVNAPIIEEFMLAMECEVISIDKTQSGDVRVVGKVVRTVADDSILDTDGHVDLDRLRPIIYDAETRTYRSLGSILAPAFLTGKSLLGE